MHASLTNPPCIVLACLTLLQSSFAYNPQGLYCHRSEGVTILLLTHCYMVVHIQEPQLLHLDPRFDDTCNVQFGGMRTKFVTSIFAT